MRKRYGWLKWVGLGFLGLVFVAFVAVQVYLRSDGARRLARETIGEIVGSPVEVTGLSVGLGSVGVTGLTIPDAKDPAAPPILDAGKVSADLGVFDLLRGRRSPRVLTLERPAVTVRISPTGEVLTGFPAPKRDGAAAGEIPAIKLVNAKVTVLQAGRPDFTLEGIGGELTASGDRWTGKLDVADPRWGQWDGTGGFGPEAGAEMRLATRAATPVTTEMLRAIPYIPPEVWDAVQLDGRTGATLQFAVDSRFEKFGYDVALTPEATTVNVAAIPLRATEASGTVKIRDAVVTLEGVKGRTADGTLDVSGTLDFRGPTGEFRLSAAADGLDMEKLPKEWKLPNIKGRLRGKTEELAMSVPPDGPLRTSGRGSAEIVGAKIGRQSARVTLELASTGTGFQFKSPGDGPQSRLEVPAWLTPLVLGAIQAPPPTPAPPKAAEPSYFRINLGLDAVDLAELLKELKVEVPFAIKGTLTVDVKADIPTDTADDLRTYRVFGTAKLPDVQLEDIALKNVAAQITFKDGKLTLDELAADAPLGADPGRVRGKASLGVTPPGDLAANLEVTALPLRQILGLVPSLSRDAEGAVTGKLVLKAPANALRDPSKWDADAELTTPRLRAAGLTAEGVAFAAALKGGKLTLPRLAATVEGAAITSGGEATLTGNYPFRAALKLDTIDLANLGKLKPGFKLPVRLAGLLNTNVDVSGTLTPLSYQTAGKVAAKGLVIDGFPVEDVTADVDLSPERVRVAPIALKLLGGDIGGSAEWPLAGAAGGKVDLSFTRLNFSELNRIVPQARAAQVSGVADGTLAVSAAAPLADGSRPIDARLRTTGGSVKVRNVAVSALAADAGYRSGRLSYNVTGNALRGKISLTGEYPAPPPPKDAADPKPVGLLKLERISVARLLESLGVSPFPGLSGELGAEIAYSFDAEGNAVGGGPIRVGELRFDNRPLLRPGVYVVRVTAAELRVTSDSEERAVRVRVPLRGALPGSAFARFGQFPVERLNGPLGLPEGFLKGTADLVLRARLGSAWTGSLTAAGPRVTLAGYPVADLRVPATWAYAPASGRGEVAAPDITATLAGGRLVGRAEAQFAPVTGAATKASFRFTNVSIPKLTGSGDFGVVSVGRATGTLDLSGTAVRSLNDLAGTLRADLGDVKSFELPVISSIAPFLNRAGGSANATARRSQVRADLRGGVWQVRRLALVGSNVKLFIEGTVALSGRLNLDVVALIGQSAIPPQLLRLAEFASPAMVGPVPLGVILRVTRYVSERSVRLSVTGTVDRPSVRVLPLKTLSDEAVRFFLGEFGAPTPAP